MKYAIHTQKQVVLSVRFFVQLIHLKSDQHYCILPKSITVYTTCIFPQKMLLATYFSNLYAVFFSSSLLSKLPV